jgi:hypothetical protein
MRVFDPFGLIASIWSFAAAHDYAPFALAAALVVVAAHVLIALGAVGTAANVWRRARERRAVIALLTPTGNLSRVPSQRTSTHDPIH